MSSLPKAQQSVAGGIFQTVTRLCITVGFGIATALFNSVSQKPSLAGYWDAEIQPYAATFWFVPFLKIGTQRGKQKEQDLVIDEITGPRLVDERPEAEKAHLETGLAEALPTTEIR